MYGLEYDLKLLKGASVRDLYSDPEGEREMRAMWFVWCYLTGVGTKSEPEIMGFTFSWRGTQCRLAVKGKVAGIPSVAFVTDRTPRGCIRTFAKWVLEDRIKWYKDKYA